MVVVWVTKRCMGNHILFLTFAEVRGTAHALGAVNDLRGNDEVLGSDLLAQRANGRKGQNSAHTQVL